jgi:hypothetical protein
VVSVRADGGSIERASAMLIQRCAEFADVRYEVRILPAAGDLFASRNGAVSSSTAVSPVTST